MKIIITIISTLTLYIAFTALAKADNFYPTGRVNNCQFASTIATQIKSTANVSVNYNSNHLYGSSGNWIQNHTIHDVADINFPNARRYTGVADKVSVPPGTQVQVGLMAWNYSGHEINTDNITFFTSHENPANGDLTRLGAGGSYGTITFDNGQASRSGKNLRLPSLGSFSNRVAHGGRIFYEFTTIQPIQMPIYEVTSQINADKELLINYKFQIHNNSTYSVCNVRLEQNLVNGTKFDKTICLNSGAVHNENFTINLGKNIPKNLNIPRLTITDNNRYIESSASRYQNSNDIYNYNARSAYIGRNDSNAPNWYAFQPAWGQVGNDLITIEIIPYWFQSGNKQFTFPNETSLEVTVSDSDEFAVKSNTFELDEEITFNIKLTNTLARLDSSQLKLSIDNQEFTTINLPPLETDEEFLHEVKHTYSPTEQGMTNYEFKAEVIYNSTVQNTDSVNSQISLEPNVELNKYSEVDGNVIDYKITIANSGNFPAKKVILTDTIPKKIELDGHNYILIIENINSEGGLEENDNEYLLEWEFEEIEPAGFYEMNFQISINPEVEVDYIRILVISNQVELVSDNHESLSSTIASEVTINGVLFAEPDEEMGPPPSSNNPVQASNPNQTSSSNLTTTLARTGDSPAKLLLATVLIMIILWGTIKLGYFIVEIDFIIKELERILHLSSFEKSIDE